MPAIGTIFAQKRNRTGHNANGAQPVRKGIPLAAVDAALTRLRKDETENKEIILTLESIEQTLKDLQGKPAMTIVAHSQSVVEDFHEVYRLLRLAGVVEGNGLYDSLRVAESAVKKAGASEPVGA